MIPDPLKTFCQEAVACLAHRGVDAATIALLRAMIAAAQNPSKLLWIAQQVSQRLRDGALDAKYLAIARQLREQTGLSPDFLLSHQAPEIVRLLVKGRVRSVFEERVLQACVDSEHLGGALLARANTMLETRRVYREQRAKRPRGVSRVGRIQQPQLRS